MPFYTRPNFEDRQQVQYSGNTITLSGETNINSTGFLQINAPILDFTGSTSASTIYNTAGVSGYVNYGKPSSFIVQPPIILQSGTTGTTTVDVTGYFLGALDAYGRVAWIQAPTGSGGTVIISGGTDYYVTGGTYSNGILTLNRQNGSVTISGFFTGDTTSGTTYVFVNFTGNTSGTCINDFWVSNISGCDLTPDGYVLHLHPYNQGVNTGYISMVENGGKVAIGSPSFSPQTILHIYGENTSSIDTLRITNSASLDHLNVTDNGQFTWDNGSSLIAKSGVTITIETGPVNGYVLTSDAIGNATWQPAPSGSGGTTTIVQFTGNTSASCITDLYVTNLNSCSPLYIQNKSFGDVLFVPNNNGNIAIGKFSATTKLDISGKTKTTEFQLTNGAVNGYVLTSDAIGNATWQPAPSGSGGTVVTSGVTSPYTFGPNVYDIVTLSGNNFTLSNQALVLGGESNIADGVGATVINGQFNILSGGTGTTIFNGSSHLITNSNGAIIGNGFLNTITGSDYASIINGDNNSIIKSIFTSKYSFIGGGDTNLIQNSNRSFIGNGSNNTINVLGIIGGYNSIVNGEGNTVSTAVSHSTIIGGYANTINYSYSSILGGQGNTVIHSNSHIIGSNITTVAPDTTYTEKIVAGADTVNSYVGHLNVNGYNTYGPMRPNYITELLTSGNTTGGTYNITIPSGWTVTDIQIYTKISDTLGSVFGATIGTSGSIWDPTTPKAFTNSHNIISLFTISENGPHYFPSSDLLSVNFVDAGANPTSLTNGEYKVLITYWDGKEIGIFL